MRYLEARRHTMRLKPGQHLSQAGVTLARRVGEKLGPFDHVITSTAPRTLETAVAMGFAVDGEYEELYQMGDDVEEEVHWPASFGSYAFAVKLNGAAARFAKKQADLWRKINKTLPDGGATLIISHGGIIELGAIGCLPEADHAAWGSHFDHCEGVRLHFDGEKFVDIEILRVEQEKA
jgi:broad specificity phosphatase PhoE